MPVKKPITFTKMQGAGNDFVVFDNREHGFLLDEIITMTPRLCHRRFGVGADGLLVLMSCKEDADYRMIYRNADGSDAGMCGNGARCLAQFATSKGFGTKLRFMVHDKLYLANVQEQEVTIHFPIEPKPGKFLNLEGFEALEVFSGTEHVVLWVDDETLENEDYLRTCGSKIRWDVKHFPKGTNVNFIPKNVTSNTIQMKTFERGVEDLTLACGTGALATSVSHHHKFGKKESGTFDYVIESNGGILKTRFHYNDSTQTYTKLELSGPAVSVFEGIYYL